MRLISTIRFCRAPESRKLSPKKTLREDLAHSLAEHPNLPVVNIAAAGGDNFKYSRRCQKVRRSFYHATEHLSVAMASVFGDGTSKTRRKLEQLKQRLLEDSTGIDSVSNAPAYLKRTPPQARRLTKELSYFRKIPTSGRTASECATPIGETPAYTIGSGVVEAACKTLVAQRLKLSGIRWSASGAQAILTLRGWHQSDRFDEARALLAATNEGEVHVVANLLDITPPPASKPHWSRRMSASD